MTLGIQGNPIYKMDIGKKPCLICGIALFLSSLYPMPLCRREGSSRTNINVTRWW